MKKPCLISSVRYGTLLNYSPRGRSDISVKSNGWCRNVKNGKVGYIEKIVARVLRESETFTDFFSSLPVLVPIPSSSLPMRDALSVPKLIADKMVEAGLGGRVSEYLVRNIAVPKSATAAYGMRPSTRDHYNSIIVNNNQVFTPKNIVLVDDVLTKGCTAYACFALLKDSFPNSNILVFAPFRTQGLIPDIEVFVEPSTGQIRFDGNAIFREP
jgi:hypothetical protein